MSVIVNDIVSLLEELIPVELAESWDNVGLMIGKRDNPVKRLLLALDITEEVVEQAIEKKCDMIITHHPLIFKGLKSVTDIDWQQELILKLIENKIAVYSAHTNLDSVSSGVNDVLAKKLKLEDTEVLDDDSNIGRIGYYPQTSLKEFAVFVKDVLHADYVVVADGKKDVHKVAVCGGAGSDFIKLAISKGADTLVTGDLKYHEAQQGAFSGLNIIDAGHQSTELPVLEHLADRLSLRFTQRNMNVFIHVAKETLLMKHY